MLIWHFTSECLIYLVVYFVFLFYSVNSYESFILQKSKNMHEIQVKKALLK